MCKHRTSMATKERNSHNTTVCQDAIRNDGSASYFRGNSNKQHGFNIPTIWILLSENIEFRHHEKHLSYKWSSSITVKIYTMFFCFFNLTSNSYLDLEVYIDARRSCLSQDHRLQCSVRVPWSHFELYNGYYNSCTGVKARTMTSPI